LFLPTLIAVLLHEASGADGTLPEPILVESITDVDAREAGELELELFTAAAGFTKDAAYAMRLEAEWRVSRLIGLKLELGFDRLQAFEPSVSAGVSFSLFHAERLGLHAQAVVYGRWPFETAELAVLDPGEPSTIVAAGVHLAWQWRLLAARLEVTGGYGGEIAHAPVRTNGAVLFGNKTAFLGFEAMADFARPKPLVLAAEAEVRQMLDDDLPLRVTLAVPFQPGSSSVAVILRVLVALGD
jgi:hypothetical protein